MPLDNKDIERLRKDPYKEESLQLLNCLVKQNEDLITLLSDLNDKKLKQLDNDVGFREMWEQLKRNDRHTAYVMVFIAVLAISLDVIQLEDFYIIQERVSNMIAPIFSLFGG